MPYTIVKDGTKFCVEKVGGKRIACHDTRAKAAAQIGAIEANEMTKTLQATQILKVDESLGLVFGFAMVCKEDGQVHVDLQGDDIPESEMLKSALSFAKGARTAKEMHKGESIGDVTFIFPLTTEIAESLEIITKRTGLLIAMRPEKPEVLQKFASGEYTGFSIGGKAVHQKV